MSSPKTFEMLLHEVKPILKSLRSNAAAGVTSFTIFEQGNGETRTHRQELHRLVGQKQAALTFDHIMRSMLNLAVMDVSRITDNPGKDRLSLKRLVSLIDGRKSDFENAALHWYDVPLGFPNPSAQSSAAKVSEEWDSFHKKWQSLEASAELKRVRKLRNNEIAHSLGKAFPLPLVMDIKHVLLVSAEIISSASFALEGLEWDLESYVVSRSENAQTFWDCFEQAMR